MFRRNGMKKLIVLTLSILVLTTIVIAGIAADKEKDTPSYGMADTSKYEVSTNRHTQYVEVQKAENLLSKMMGVNKCLN